MNPGHQDTFEQDWMALIVRAMKALGREVMRDDPEFWESIPAHDPPRGCSTVDYMWWSTKQYFLTDPDIRDLESREMHRIKAEREANRTPEERAEAEESARKERDANSKALRQREREAAAERRAARDRAKA